MLQLPNPRVVFCFILQLITFTNINSRVTATNDLQLQSVFEPNRLSGFKVTGNPLETSFGRDVCNAGDVNGDGVDDLIILSPSDSKVHVLYGNTSGLSDLNVASDFFGFTIHADIAPSGTMLSMYVDGVGDFNKDGFNDIAVGFPAAGDTFAGVVFVIFGKSTRESRILKLSFLSSMDGFRIFGANAGDNCGIQVRAAGDVNGDTFSDLIIGCNFFSVAVPGQQLAMVGKAYVIYGNKSNADIYLEDTNPARGFAITGRDADARLGTSVAGVGDVNNDGVDDVAVTTAATDATTAAPDTNIAVCVIFGSRDASLLTDIFLEQELPPQRGVIYMGADGVYAISAAGDVNKDGYADIVLGARQGSLLDRTNAGLAYVLLGGPNDPQISSCIVYLSDFISMPELGFMLIGASAGDAFGVAVNGGSDINGDGYADVMIGAPFAEVAQSDVPLPYAGVTYVIFGGPDGLSMDMLTFVSGAAGFKILGAHAGDRSGRSVSATGDYNGDGVVDLVIGAVQVGVVVNDIVTGNGPGLVYVLNGNRLFSAAPSAVPSRSPSRTPSRKPSYVPTTQPTTPTLPPVVTSHKDYFIANLLSGAAGGTGLAFHGPQPNAQFGSAVSSGDVNGDKKCDLLVGAPGYSSGRGAVYVVLNRAGSAYVTNTSVFANDMRNGYMVLGAVGEALGGSVGFCDDVNGDGTGDIVIGTAGFGRAYVIYGVKTTFRPQVTVSSLALADGYVIQTPKAGLLAVSGGGDVNGDGLGDVIVGSSANNTAWVVFGTRDLRSTVFVGKASFGGTNGFRVVGPVTGYLLASFGNSVSRAGDLNGDGFADIIIGSNLGSMGTISTRACVVFGHSNRTTFSDVRLVSTPLPMVGGFVLIGRSINYVVSSAGDFNNDGYDDFIISDYYATVGTTFLAGISYVIFGQSTATSYGNIYLDTFINSALGFTIVSSTSSARNGWAVSAAGDLNGDGIDDLLVGAYLSSLGPSGAVYAIFGHNRDYPFPDIKLDAFYATTRGFRVFAANSMDLVGSVVSAAGDLNHDGLGDFMIGAPGAGFTNGAGSGSAYVVYGTTPTAAPTSAPSRTPTKIPTKTPTAVPTIPPIATIYRDFNLSRDGTNNALGFRISGTDKSTFGADVTYGDVNGDGVSDVLVSAPMASYAGRLECGIVVILFGRGSAAPSPNIDIATLTPDMGVVVYGNATQRMGYTVVVLDDVNGDNIVDFLVGSQSTASSDGAVFVVYGRHLWTDIDLLLPLAASSPPSGFQILLPPEWGTSSLAALVRIGRAGDINGDGLSDLIIANAIASTSEIIVLFGSSSGGNVDLSSFVSGVQGYRIFGNSEFRIGLFMSDVGDFNGDGFADIIISAQKLGSMMSNYAPIVQVLYGHSNRTAFTDVLWSEAQVFNNAGFAVFSADAVGSFRVSGAGDFNGDGYDDIVIGNPSYTASSTMYAGRTLVLFGQNSTVPFPSIDFATFDATSSIGFVIGGAYQDYSGTGVASAGDVNGDGFDDILVGARTALVLNAGVVYALFGHSSALPFPDINLGDFYAQTRGFRILGGGLGGILGQVVSSAGDLNQDGYADIVVTVSSADTLGRTNNGAAYVIYGRQEAPTATPTVLPSVAPSRAPTQAPTLPPVNTVFGDYPLGQLYNHSGTTGFAIFGAASEMVGISVDSGDFNGDSYLDLLVSSPYADANAGKVYVLFGTEAGLPRENIDLSVLPFDAGVEFSGLIPNTYVGNLLANAGDMNDDGVDDILIGCPDSQDYKGVFFVLYGGQHLQSRVLHPLEQLPIGAGFRVFDAPGRYSALGYMAKPIGDFNGDGFDDVAISAYNLPYKDRLYSGMVLVLYGGQLSEEVNVTSFAAGERGFRMFGETRSQLGATLDHVDFNGDGRRDLLIKSTSTGTSTMVGMLLFGRSTFDPISEDMDLLNGLPVAAGLRFMSLTGAQYAFKNAGDMNGDGFEDIIASRAGGPRLPSTGAQVIFGRSDAASLETIVLDSYVTRQSLGFEIVFRTAGTTQINSISSAGDFNNDGFADLMVGLVRGVGSDAVYIIFGHSDATEFPLLDLSRFYESARGARLIGRVLGESTGYCVRGLGDINGDGIDDVAVTAPQADVHGRINAGAVYVLYGNRETPTASPSVNPTVMPTVIPTVLPSIQPSRHPSQRPSFEPTIGPTGAPTTEPTSPPTTKPSNSPSVSPSRSPVTNPTAKPSIMPTADPTLNPTRNPSAAPTLNPTLLPTGAPTAHSTILPTEEPSFRPTAHPSTSPSAFPTVNPSQDPSCAPTVLPSSVDPSIAPTMYPTESPTEAPSFIPPTTAPTASATAKLTSAEPSVAPTSGAAISAEPSSAPTAGATVEFATTEPSVAPTASVTAMFTSEPSSVPLSAPTKGPELPPSAPPTQAVSTGPTGSPSTESPTVLLSLEPSGQPTGHTTVDPTVGPTNTPSPSIDPFGGPSMDPTPDPIADLTADPTVAPSVTPREDPSLHPTATPTGEPSMGPTVQPTYEPSVDPTASPTSSPTVLLTAAPSVGPTLKPSEAPIFVPTADPSAVPSASPSVKPTRKPSTAPSAPPSVGPTFVPSVLPGNTQAPSRAPTQSPTLSAADLWRGVLQDLLQTVTVGNSADVAHVATYSELVVATSTPPNLYGSCASWRTLLQGELTTSNALYRPLSLTLGAQQSLINADAPSVVTCGDATSANTILQALLANSEQLQSVTCSERNWVVRSCSACAAPALCVECEDPCAPALHCASTSATSSVNSLSLAPCVAAPVCTGATGLASEARVLSVSYKELQPAPTVVTQTHTASKTTVTVQTTLSTAGSVSCGAFEVNAQSGEASVPTSISQIMLQKFVASTDITNTASVMLSGLQAASKYQIYCVAVSPLGTQQTLTQAAAQSFAVSTACCIDVSVRAATSAIKTGSMTSNFLTIAVASRPAASVSLLVSLHAASTGAVATSGSFFPASFTLTALQQATGSAGSQSSASVFTASLPSLPAGDYFYNVTLSGESAYQYAVSYVHPSTALAVLSANEPLPAPILASAVFADDGSHVVISFSAKSNKGNTATEFNCALLFNFACADKTTCVWTSSSQVSAYVSSTTGCAAVDSPVSLISSAAVRAECSGSSCDNLSSWPTSSTTVTVAIQSPVSAIVPTVVLSAPNSIGECDALTQDLSSSSGNGGRPWASRTVLVDSLAPSEVTSALQHLLDTSDQSSALLTIPASSIGKGYAYSFTVKQCNFLGRCGQSTKRVLAQSSTIPTVTLPGSPLRTVKRSASLSISSEAYFVPCGGSASRAGLTYSWSLAVGGVQDLSFTSASRDPSKLLIAANTLAVNTLYDVTLTVTIASTLQSASASVQVFVAPGNIVPVVALGVSRAVRVDQVVTLDARGSYDEDQVGLSASAAGMTFGWSCVQVAPVLADSCSNALSISSSGNEGTFVGRAGANAAGAVVQVTLTLLDASQSRIAQTVVTVSVLPSLSPVVTATSNAADTGILNSNRELQLVGEVTFPVGFNGSATWSVDDTSAFSLSDSARSPLVTLIGSSGAPQAIYLVVAANSLPDRSTLTFSLTARLHAAGGTSGVALVPVRVNAPPMLGLFSVSPRNGTEIVDKFSFVASQWVDSDLPLQYLFGYASPSGVEVTLRSKREAAFSTLTLTAGLETDAYAVRCVMHVFDALSAASTRLLTVNVFPEERDAAALTGLIESSLAEGEDSVDGRKQSAALGSYLLNQVNCTAAPNCTALNRQNCFRTAHTCGECLSTSYVGTAGDSNQACVSVTDLATRRRSLYNNKATSSNGPVRCSSDAQCNLFEMCSSSGVCVRELMQCKGNCSYPQGTCKFVDVNSGDAVDVCYVGDSTCTATCDCAEEFTGSETCSLTASQLLDRQGLRLRLVQSITKLIASEDADLESVVGWINTLLQVAQVPDELSEDAAHLLLGAADSIIATASRLGVSTDTVTSLLTAVDAVVQASNDRSVRRRRVLSMGSASADTRRLLRSENELHNSTLTRSASTLSQFRSFLQQSLLPNQNAVKLVLPQFRIVSQVLTGDDATVSMGLPLSALETANGQSSSQISVPADSTGDSALYISLSSLRSEPFNRELGLSGYEQVFSNPLAVDLTGSSCSGDQCRFQMTLQTSTALSAAVNNLPVVESYNTTCVAGVVTSSEITCADGSVIPVQCDGTDSVVVSICPVVTYSPVCNALVGVNGPAASGCTIVSTTATSLTCSCPINAANSHSRRMQTESSPADDAADGSVSVSYVGMLTQIKGNFVNTIVSAQSLNASTLERGWSAMATVGALAVAILFAFYWSHQADAEMEKIVPASEKAKKLAIMNPALPKTDKRRAQPAKLKRAAKVVVNRDVQIAEQALPSILSSQSLSKRVTVEVKQHHKWFGIVFHFSRSFPRVLRVASLATNVIIMLFIQSLTYSLTSGDDGSCATYTSHDACVEERSAYATGASKCYWTESSGECAFVEPDGDIMVILFVAIFSAIVCTPFALLVDWIIIYVLSAPTKASGTSYLSGTPRAGSNRNRLRTASGEFIESASPTTADSRARTVSTDVYEMTNAIMMGSSRRRTRNESMDIHSNRGRTLSTNSEMFEIIPGQINTMNIGDGHGSARDSVFGSFITLRGNDAAVDNGIQLSAQSDLRLLVEDISRYRDTLSEEDRVEFDLLWGLDEHGCFKSDDELQTGLLHRLKKMFTFSSQSNAVSSGSVSQRVLLDLRAVHENLAKEEALAAARKFDNRQKGRRLLFLFQRDLLPGVSGMILESKGQRDNISAPQVSREAKIAAWSFLAVANVGMLFYILLFALSQTTHRQGAWALSFILWLVVEILLVSSATVVFTHILVPSLIMQDVKKIKMKLVESIRAFNHNVKNRTMYEEDAEQGENGGSCGGPFNAANYLFTSTRLAKKWPELREAQIISQFRTPWPKQSYMRESSVSTSYSRKYTALTRSASIIVIFFMTQILQVPPGLQDMVVQMVATASIGYTILLHLNLYQIFPLLAFLPLMLVIVIVHFVMQSSKASAQQEMNKLLATPPAPPANKGKGSGSPRLQHIAPAGEKVDADELAPERTIWQHISGSFDAVDAADSEEEAEEGELMVDAEDLPSDNEDCGGEDIGELHLPATPIGSPVHPFAQPKGHVNRKQSVLMGVQVLRELESAIGRESKEEFYTSPIVHHQKVEVIARGTRIRADSSSGESVSFSDDDENDFGGEDAGGDKEMEGGSSDKSSDGDNDSGSDEEMEDVKSAVPPAAAVASSTFSSEIPPSFLVPSNTHSSAGSVFASTHTEAKLGNIQGGKLVHQEQHAQETGSNQYVSSGGGQESDLFCSEDEDGEESSFVLSEDSEEEKRKQSDTKAVPVQASPPVVPPKPHVRRVQSAFDSSDNDFSVSTRSSEV